MSKALKLAEIKEQEPYLRFATVQQAAAQIVFQVQTPNDVTNQCALLLAQHYIVSRGQTAFFYSSLWWHHQKEKWKKVVWPCETRHYACKYRIR